MASERSKGRDAIGVAALEAISGGQIIVTGEGVWSELNHALEHFGGLVVLSITQVEDAQQIVTAPVLRTQADDPLVSLLSLVQLTQKLVGPGEPDVALIARGIEFHRPLELLYRLLILTRSVSQQTEALVAFRSSVTQLHSFVAIRSGQGDPFLVLGVLVLAPVSFSQPCLGKAVGWIKLQGLSEENKSAVDVVEFEGVLQVPAALEVVVVRLRLSGAVRGKLSALLGPQLGTEGAGRPLSHSILNAK